jgi:hypothetical protein
MCFDSTGGAALPILSTRSQHLWDALEVAYRVLGLDAACDHDEVFQALVLARTVEPTSKLEAIRVLEEIGITAPSYPTINRRLPSYATPAVAPAVGSSVRGPCRVGPGDPGDL